MGCEFDYGDDFEKCECLIEEYEDLLCKEGTDKLNVDKNKNKGTNQEKEELKNNIKDMLEIINKKATSIAQIDKLQKLNEKYQILLTEESRA